MENDEGSNLAEEETHLTTGSGDFLYSIQASRSRLPKVSEAVGRYDT
jgi:hypothetical protein